jgi:hypothetical protein
MYVCTYLGEGAPWILIVGSLGVLALEEAQVLVAGAKRVGVEGGLALDSVGGRVADGSGPSLQLLLNRRNKPEAYQKRQAP